MHSISYLHLRYGHWQVLFRNNFALSREIAGLFQSFQASSTILDPAANPTLFQSRLLVIIKVWLTSCISSFSTSYCAYDPIGCHCFWHRGSQERVRGPRRISMSMLMKLSGSNWRSRRSWMKNKLRTSSLVYIKARCWSSHGRLLNLGGSTLCSHPSGRFLMDKQSHIRKLGYSCKLWRCSWRSWR